MRSPWTDGRLDDLSNRMEEGFRRVDADLRDIRGDLISFSGRFDALQRTLIQCSVGLATSFVALIVAFVLTAH